MQTIIDHEHRLAASEPIWTRRIFRWLESPYFIPCFLLTFAVVWTAIFSIAYYDSDLHKDTLETWTVGRVFAWGIWKHPPLMGWAANIWTHVFPLTNWSFRLLSMANAALALYAVDLIARRFVSKDKRVLILLLLLLTPVYQFHAENFNANSVLLAVWPLATYCFLRSFEERTAFWSVMAGVVCAVAMLGKYYSIFLLIGFALAGVLHPDRRAYLRSSAPWISLLAGLAAITPHLHWLATTGFEPFHYAIDAHSGRSLAVVAWGALMFALTNAGYLILPAVALMYVIHPSASSSVLSRARLTGGTLLLSLVFIISFVLPMLVVIGMHADLPTNWHLQGLFLVVVVAVASLPSTINRNRLFNLCAATAGLWLTALTISPIYALYRDYVPLAHGHSFYHQASDALTNEWHKTYHEPLGLISGDDGLAFATAFYSPDHPFYARPFRHQYEWGTPRLTTLHKGWSALCYSDDGGCLTWMARVAGRSPDARRWDFDVTNDLFGIKGASTHISALLMPPPPTINPQAPADDTPDNAITDLSARGKSRNNPARLNKTSKRPRQE